jgi:NAD(P)-dependent dehydrogenase (short-subunit alcohol dehydrogenase family)
VDCTAICGSINSIQGLSIEAEAEMTERVDHESVLLRLFGLKGRIALVTGGGSGLGYAFASVLADVGAHVVVADVDAERALKAAGQLAAAGAASPLVLDVADQVAVDEAVDGIVRDHGRLDIAFANAGIARGTPPLVDSGFIDSFGLEDYDALIDVNLHGVVYTIRAAARHMKERRSGSIVATASTAGLRNDPFVPYSYAIAKAGVVNLVKQAAHDLARWNVRVNAIAPGPFKTNLGGGGPTSAAAEERWKAVIPLGRMGDPSEIRGLALLLASDAGSFMTGGVYPIDGGALLQGPSLPPG